MNRLSSAAALLALILGVTSPAGAEVQSNFHFPFSGAYFNPCLGELVSFTGSVHLLNVVQGTGNGTLVRFHVNQTFSGTGQITGLTYRGMTVIQLSFFFDPPLPYDSTNVNAFRLITTGDANDYTARSILHVTINANKEVTAHVTSIEIGC